MNFSKLEEFKYHRYYSVLMILNISNFIVQTLFFPGSRYPIYAEVTGALIINEFAFDFTNWSSKKTWWFLTQLLFIEICVLLILVLPSTFPKLLIFFILLADILYFLFTYRSGRSKSKVSQCGSDELSGLFHHGNGAPRIIAGKEMKVQSLDFKEVKAKKPINPFSDLNEGSNLEVISESIYNLVKDDPEIVKLFSRFSHTEFIEIIKGTLRLFTDFCSTTGKAPAIPVYIQFLLNGRFHILPSELGSSDLPKE
jgi:hypothetical protein